LPLPTNNINLLSQLNHSSDAILHLPSGIMRTWKRNDVPTRQLQSLLLIARWIPTLALFGDALQSREIKFLIKNFYSINNFLINFSSLWETIQTLFWAVFGLVDLDSFELDGIKIFTRFWGM